MDNDVDLKYRNCKYFKENECKYLQADLIFFFFSFHAIARSPLRDWIIVYLNPAHVRKISFPFHIYLLFYLFSVCL